MTSYQKLTRKDRHLEETGHPSKGKMAGKCIVTLNKGDTARFIKNGDNGVLLEYEELPELLEVIRKLLADKELRQRLGANARQFALENFWTWEERMNAEIQAVENLLK